MKKTFLIALLVFIASPCLAGSVQDKLKGAIEKKNGVAAANYCDGKTSLACDDFETTGGTCGDDANTNCRVTWSGSANTTFNNKITGLSGAYAKQIDAASSYTGTSTITFSAGNDRYAFFLINITTLTISGNSTFAARLFGAGGAVCGLKVQADKSWGLISDATGITAVGASPTAGTTYAVWLERKNNTANTGCSVYIAAATCTGTPLTCSAAKPALTKGITTGNYGTAESLSLYSFDQTSFGDVDPVVYDNVRVRASAIGDNGND